MNSTEAKQAVDLAQAELDAATKEWHEALIRESPFRVGDRVRNNWGISGEIVDVYVEPHSVSLVYLVNVRASEYIHTGMHLTRIDESGNPLGPREKEEA